uniref:Uncharacterized protein n=1 Tax=Cannabis sativa TaxID=3483 RepID=A0A803QIE7_CANSA
MDSTIKNSKRPLSDCLIEDLESDKIPVVVPLERVTLVQNPECDKINVGETVIVNGEDPEIIGYLIGPLDEGMDGCRDECSSEPTGFLNENHECILTNTNLKKWRISYDIPSNVEMRLPKSHESRLGYGRLDPIIFRKRYYAKEHEKEKGGVLLFCCTRKKPFVTCLTKADDSDWKKAYCFFRDKMSQKRTIKILKASDAMDRDKLTTTKKLKTEESKQVSESNFTDAPLTLSSLDGILHPADRARLIKLGSTGVSSNGVADGYKILQAILFIRENYPALEKRTKLTADNAFLKLENGKHVEKERELEETIESLKGELKKVKQGLIDEKKRAEDLVCKAEQVALTVVIKTCGELMI